VDHRPPVRRQAAALAGTLEQIRSDVDAVRALGADEILIDACYTPPVRSAADLLEWAEQLWSTFH
jgi:hypothetical protein